MAALTRKESEERQAAVLRFFVENPRATGEEAQKALTSGRLTGNKGPPMGQGMLYKLQRQSQELLAKGARPAPVDLPIRGDSTVLDQESLNAIRERAKELQRLLEEGGPIREVHITKDGVRVVRTTVTEDKF